MHASFDGGSTFERSYVPIVWFVFYCMFLSWPLVPVASGTFIPDRVDQGELLQTVKAAATVSSEAVGILVCRTCRQTAGSRRALYAVCSCSPGESQIESIAS